MLKQASEAANRLRSSSPQESADTRVRRPKERHERRSTAPSLTAGRGNRQPVRLPASGLCVRCAYRAHNVRTCTREARKMVWRRGPETPGQTEAPFPAVAGYRRSGMPGICVGNQVFAQAAAGGPARGPEGRGEGPRASVVGDEDADCPSPSVRALVPQGRKTERGVPIASARVQRSCKGRRAWAVGVGPKGRHRPRTA